VKEICGVITKKHEQLSLEVRENARCIVFSSRTYGVDKKGKNAEEKGRRYQDEREEEEGGGGGGGGGVKSGAYSLRREGKTYNKRGKDE